MTGLYPIIRRARRPLIIQDDDAGPPPAPPPVVPLLEGEEPFSYAKRPTQVGEARAGRGVLPLKRNGANSSPALGA
jgi:hypothetical protein